jgi:hypothetical protein
MSWRTLIEINHVYYPSDEGLLEWARALQTFIRSGTNELLPRGIAFKQMRHRSDPDQMKSIGDPS